MNQPGILYKYMPSSYEADPKTEADYLKCLDNGLVKYSSIKDLNDPHELMPFTFSTDYRTGLVAERTFKLKAIDRLNVSRQEKFKLKKTVYKWSQTLLSAVKQHDPEMDSMMYENLKTRREGNWGVFCLSETWQSLVMWHFYASSQSGVCIGWDSKCPFFQKSSPERRGNDYGFLPVEKVDYVETSEKAKVDVLTDGANPRTFFIKHNEWSYEREWRSIVRWDALTGEVATRSYSKAGLIHLGVKAIKEIMVGLKCHPVARDKAVKFGKMHGVPVFLMSLSNEHFGARRELLTA